MKTLGRLRRVDLRDIWKTEDRDFTPWLAQEENISVLAETLGLELEVEAQEKDVGPYRADILCKDTAEDTWVLVENQLEKTDHRHLGQLLTYAAGLKAVTIVWVAHTFTDEHRAALDWLNSATDKGLRLFGLEVELWQIGDSPAAPKFNVVSKPNEWTRTVGAAAKRLSDEAVTPTKQLQLEFWQELNAALSLRTNLKSQKPRPQHWSSVSIGKSGFSIGGLVNSRDGKISVEFHMSSEDAKAHFIELSDEREEIERQLGFQPDWLQLPHRRACRIVYHREDSDLENRDQWLVFIDWMLEHLQIFDGVFRQRVKTLNPDLYRDRELKE